MKLPNLNLNKYISNASEMINQHVYIQGDHLEFNMNLEGLTGNLGKYFTVLTHFFNTHNNSIKETPATVILDADIKTKTDCFIFNFNESLKEENCFYDINYRSTYEMETRVCCRAKNVSLDEAKRIITNKFVDHILIPMQEILQGNEPLLTKTISVTKHGKELFSFSTYWFESIVTYNIVNKTDFSSDIIKQANDLFTRFLVTYNQNYKDAYKLYEHFERIGYGQRSAAKEMVAIFDILIISSECKELALDCDNEIAISENNSYAEQISIYPDIVLGNKYQNNIIGIGKVSAQMLIDASKKAKDRHLQNQFAEYVSNLVSK